MNSLIPWNIETELYKIQYSGEGKNNRLQMVQKEAREFEAERSKGEIGSSNHGHA